AETDENGVARFEGLRSGARPVGEEQAPAGYEMLGLPQTVTVDEHNNRDVKLEITNELIRGSITITKVDEEDTSKKLPGAIFELVHPDYETVVGVAETDENGVARFEGLLPGTYTLKELQAPEGYDVLGLPQTVTVGEDQQERDVQVTVKNRKQLFDVDAELTKVVECLADGYAKITWTAVATNTGNQTVDVTVTFDRNDALAQTLTVAPGETVKAEYQELVLDGETSTIKAI